ncbi:MAG: hypothetical protein ABID61_02275 [Candidatus Micrarchaeota archaeon]
MKLKYLVFTLILLGMVFASSGSSNLKNAMNQLQDATKNMMGITTILGLGIGVVFLAIALSIYFFVKGVQGVLKIAMFICGILGVLALLGGIISIVLFLLTPSIIGGITGS